VDLTKRYQSAAEMIADIEILMRARHLMPYEESLRNFLRAPNEAKNIRRAPKDSKKRGPLVWGISLGLFLVALWTAGILFQSRVTEERNPKNDPGLQTAPDAKTAIPENIPAPAPVVPPVVESVKPPEPPPAKTQPIKKAPAKSKPVAKVEPKPAPEKPFGFTNLSPGIFIGQEGQDLKTFAHESFETYRERVRPKKSALLVSSRFGDVDLEMNPFTQDLKLEWQLGPEASAYRLEVAADRSFKTPLFTGSVPSKFMTLERFWASSQTLFWRISYLDESQNVFLIDPIRRINLKLKGSSDYFDIMVPRAGDSFHSKSLVVKAFGPESGSLRCATLNNSKGLSEWISSYRDGSFLTANLYLSPDVSTVICEAKDKNSKVMDFVIPISVAY
jgi:hypothetical protein